MDTALTDALMKRVDDVVVPGSEPPLTERVSHRIEADREPLLATTPTSVAIRQLAARIEALEGALREIADAVDAPGETDATTPRASGARATA